MSTVFEKIIAGEIPANKVYEDNDTFAFLDADPVNPGHTLVIPKEAYENIYTIPKATFVRVMKTVHTLAPIVKKAVDADGINVGNNNEKAAGQEVSHFHVHIMPRFAKDGFSHWQGAENYHKDQQGEKIAEEIKTYLQ